LAAAALAQAHQMLVEHQATILYLAALPQLVVAVEVVEHLQRMD
jgi:hypothetical protein